jgi:hypothetical protein
MHDEGLMRPFFVVLDVCLLCVILINLFCS